jgi:hypothetical protein
MRQWWRSSSPGSKNWGDQRAMLRTEVPEKSQS